MKTDTEIKKGTSVMELSMVFVLRLSVRLMFPTVSFTKADRSPASPGNLPYLWPSWRRPGADGPQAECELWYLWHVLRGIWGTNTADDPNMSCNSDLARNCTLFRINISKYMFFWENIVLKLWSELERSEHSTILNQALCIQERLSLYHCKTQKTFPTQLLAI